MAAAHAPDSPSQSPDRLAARSPQCSVPNLDVLTSTPCHHSAPVPNFQNDFDDDHGDPDCESEGANRDSIGGRDSGGGGTRGSGGAGSEGRESGGGGIGDGGGYSGGGDRESGGGGGDSEGGGSGGGDGGESSGESGGEGGDNAHHDDDDDDDDDYDDYDDLPPGEHESNRNLGRYACRLCKYKGNKKKNLQRHIKRRHSDRPPTQLRCEFCPDFTTIYPKNLRRHMEHSCSGLKEICLLDADTLWEVVSEVSISNNQAYTFLSALRRKLGIRFFPKYLKKILSEKLNCYREYLTVENLCFKAQPP